MQENMLFYSESLLFSNQENWIQIALIQISKITVNFCMSNSILSYQCSARQSKLPKLYRIPHKIFKLYNFDLMRDQQIESACCCLCTVLGELELFFQTIELFQGLIHMYTIVIVSYFKKKSKVFEKSIRQTQQYLYCANRMIFRSKVDSRIFPEFIYITAKMNKEEALKTDLQAKEYIEKNKLRHLFTEITKELLLKRPDDPINYLIDYIEKRNKRQIICIQGYEEEKRNKIATTLSNKFNFGLINLHAIFGTEDYYFENNKTINEKVLAELKKVDKIYKGVVISGYPNNANQADFIQKSGILPDRYFLLYNDEPAIRQAYQKKHSEEDAELMMDRNSLELKELKELLGNKYDQLPLGIDKAIQKVNSSIDIRFRKMTPYDAPRIVVIHPPYLFPKALIALIEKFSLNHISVESSFKKMAQKEKFKNYVETHIRQNKSLSKEVELALIETETKSAASKNKGFIVTGWPSKKFSVNFLKQSYLSPHIIFVFNSVKDKALEEFEKLDRNDPELFCISQKPNLEQYKAMYKEFESIVEAVKGFSNCQLMTLAEQQVQLIKTFESLIENPKIYG